MKRKRGWLLGPLVILALLFCAVPAYAADIPAMPHPFYGTVTIGGTAAPVETVITAEVGGVQYGSYTTTIVGHYGSSDPLEGDYLLVSGDIETGATIYFYVNGTQANEWHAFSPGADPTELDLTVTAPDETPPTVEITSTASDPTNTSPIPMTATFSETITGFVVGDITVGNGSADNFVAVSGTVYTFDVTPTAEGAVTVDIAAGVAQDAATNPNEAATQFSITYDSTNPTVTITSTASDPTNISPIPMTATFSETVTGFVVGDITVGNGAASNFVAVSGTVYTFDVTPTAEGAVTVDIAAGVAQDAATNPNEAATQFSITYTTAVLAVTIDAVTTPTNVATQTLTGTMSEGLTVVLTADTAATFGAVSYPTGTTWSCDVTLVEGSNGITATADTSTATATIVLDTIAPTVVSKSPAAGATGVAVSTTVSVIFSEAMDSLTITTTSFTLDSVSGSVSYDSGTYTATFTPSDNLTLDTTYTASIQVSDLTGNSMAEAHTWSFTTVALDTTPPTVVSKSPAAGETGVAVDTTVSVTFSEAMDESTITTSSFTLDSVSGSVSYDSGTYTATFTPSANLANSTTYTATLSTAITDVAGNPLASAYTWSFTTVMGNLGDEIDVTPPGGTVELGTGTYTGDVIIDKPITITGTEGTIISGSITIGELTGSDVTIENLIITDYTEFGIRIVKVRAVDTFVIQNNTILGVEGSLIGIEVVEVEGGGILNIRKNAISGNEVGIKLLANVADATIHFNDITDNTVFGLEQLAVVSNASTFCNWWGDISGPEYEAASFQYWPNNPGGLGDAVSDNVGFTPWLTRDFQTVLDDNIAYFGYPMVWLYTGWNIMSTPVALDPACDTWGEYVDLGDGLDVHATSPAYRFNSQTQAWVALTSDDTLDPCDAIYVRMASDDIAAIVYSPNLSVPSKELYAGWNLVSLAWIHREEYAKPANEALVTVEEVAGGLTGYKLVVSPGVNAYETSWIYIAGDSIEPWTDPEAPPDGWMWMTSGYWVFMLNDGTLAGFTFTPVSLGM